jgi:iron complex outermembrane recepter protein
MIRDHPSALIDMTQKYCLCWIALGVSGLCSVHAQSLPSVTVTAPAADETTPVGTSLGGAELDRRRAVSLGDTLDGQVGVSSSGFSTAAGRPVIRGQSGSRVTVAENGLDSLDASDISPDHAVTVDPLAARRIEVLRGPSTLLYGGNAVGGLVNSISDLIPTTALRSVSGDLLLGADSASLEKLGAVRLRGGSLDGTGLAPTPGGGSLNWTLGGFARDASDYRIPGNATLGDPSSPTGRLPNSYNRSQGASAGVSWVDRWGVVGLSHTELHATYGTPSEQSVYIDQRNHRTEGLLELDQPVSWLESLRVKAAQVRYRHQEIDASNGEVATQFDSTGYDARLEAAYLPVAGISGVFGLSSRDRTLSSSGSEAYIPSTTDRQNAVFLTAARALGDARLALGTRQSQARLDPTGNPDLPMRNFTLSDYSLGLQVPVRGPVALSINLASAQRAPSVPELYADGPHAATATYEIGNSTLDKERSRNIELSLGSDATPLRWKASVFQQRFENYIAGFATDVNNDGVADRTDDAGTIVNSPQDPSAGPLQRIAYQQAPARFRGLELELGWRPENSAWGWRTFADMVRGTVDGIGDAPRLPPVRVGVSTDYASGPWTGFASVMYAAQQNRTSPFETPTPSYTRVDSEIAYKWKTGSSGSTTLFVAGRNLLNEDIRLSTSYVMTTVPMPGRSFYAGLRVRF